MSPHTIPQRWYKRLRVTFILFGLSIIATGVVYYVSDARQATQANSTNRLVCVTRPYIRGSLARAVQSAGDVKQPESVRKRAAAAVVANTIFLQGLVTVPAHYDCAPLVARIRKEALHG